MKQYRQFSVIDLTDMIIITLLCLFLFFGCATFSKGQRHESRYEAAKVQKENFKALADAWLFDWLTVIAPQAGGGSLIAGLIAYLSHRRGKEKGILFEKLNTDGEQ